MRPAGTLLAPRHIAVVGASASRPTAGSAVIANLRRLGYGGAIYPVNPRYAEIDGLRCYPSLSDIPDAVDVAFIGVPAAGVVPIVEEAGRRGIPAVVVTASGFADAGPEGTALQTRLAAAAAAGGISLCGPNNMGVVNWLDGVAIWTGTLTPPLRTGPIGMISQSGSVSMLAAADDRNLGFGIIIGSGNEAVLTSAEYLDALVRDDRIAVIVHFLETIKKPEVYAAAALEARARGKPIVVLKVGRTDRGRRATVAHTGSLAGADEEFEAFCRAYGLLRVRTLDEMLETAEAFARGRPVPRGPAVGLVAMSGGEVALLADLADEANVPLAEFAPATRDALAGVFPSYTTIGNPLDAWGAGWDAATYRAAAQALSADPAVGVLAISLDPDARNGRASTPVAREIAEIHLDLRRRGESPAGVVIFNNSSAALSPVLRGLLDGSGIPYLQGTDEALRAIGHWVRYHASRLPSTIPAGAPAYTRADPPAPLTPLLRHRTNATALSLDEPASSALLSSFGIRVARGLLARTAEAAARHAAAIGYPVALKAVAAGLPHKSDAGGVVLGVASAAQARAAFKGIVNRVRAARPGLHLDGVLVAEMVPPGLEMILGASFGPYGPAVVVGVGGVDVEARRDAAWALAPVDDAEARAMVGRLRAAALLGTTRGRPARDVNAVADMLVRLSHLAVECAPWLEAVDVNPVIVGADGEGACAVDALVVLRPDAA